MPSPLVSVTVNFMADPKYVGRRCKTGSQMPNSPCPAMGGHRFRVTLAARNGYKRQNNKLTRRRCTLDPIDTRIAWGPDSGR